MFKVEMNSIKMTVWMEKEEFKNFMNDNLLSVFTDGELIFTMYNGFVIGCIRHDKKITNIKCIN